LRLATRAAALAVARNPHGARIDVLLRQRKLGTLAGSFAAPALCPARSFPRGARTASAKSNANRPPRAVGRSMSVAQRKGSPTCAGVLYVAPTCCLFYRLSWRSQTVQKRRQVFVRITIRLPPCAAAESTRACSSILSRREAPGPQRGNATRDRNNVNCEPARGCRALVHGCYVL
jgi:hypothetical protein